MGNGSFEQIQEARELAHDLLQEARELAHDLFHQACATHPTSSDDPNRGPAYDHCCLSTYEDAQRKLIEWNLIKREDCVRK